MVRVNTVKERRALQGLIGFFLILLFLELPGSWLFDPDEPRYAEIPREMLITRDFVTPRLNGSHYFEKPPLFYWMSAGSMHVLGQTPYAARLPVRLAALGTTLLLIFFVGASPTNAAGLWAGLIYLSSLLPFILGRINIIDGVLSFFLALAFLSLEKFLNSPEQTPPKIAHQIGIAVGTALAVLAKGLVGVVFPGLVTLLWLAMFQRWNRLPKLLFSWTPLIFFGLTVPWFILVEKANPGFSKFFFIHEHFQRFATNEANRPGPIYYFIPVFLFGFLPWTFFFGGAVKSLVRTLHKKVVIPAEAGIQSVKPFSNKWFKTWIPAFAGMTTSQQKNLFFVLWFAVIFVFFSLSHSKLIPYILPAFPAVAALLGSWMASSPKNLSKLWKPQILFWSVVAPAGVVVGIKSGFLGRYDLVVHALLIAALMLVGAWSRRVLVQTTAWGGIYLVLIFATSSLAKDYSDHDLAVAASQAGGDQVVSYLCYPQSFPWVFKKTIPVVDFQGELASDDLKNPDLFWSRKTFWEKWNSEEHLIVYIHNNNREEFDQPTGKRATLLAQNRRSMVLANFQPVGFPSSLPSVKHGFESSLK